MATSITKNNFTWRFDKDYTVGNFANGDWYVVDHGSGVRIVEILPTDGDKGDSNNSDGSMINPPYNAHAYDSRMVTNRYNETLDVARDIPFTLRANQSLVSTQSYVAGTSGNWTEFADVLTCLSSVPPAGSFRPPYVGTEKGLFNKNDIDYSVFQNLSAPPSAPSVGGMLNGQISRFFIDHIPGWQNSNVKAKGQTDGYGREIASDLISAALLLNINMPDSTKEPLAIRLIQRGIDFWGAIKAGMRWLPDGGHNFGRKIALFVAGRALNNQEMLDFCDAGRYDFFQEDTQHFYVSQSDIDTPRFPSDKEPYTSAHLGMPEWGSQTPNQPERNSPSWTYTGYRQINGGRNIGFVLCVELMGGVSICNSPALFDYINQRYWPRETTTPTFSLGSTNGLNRFFHDMWVLHKGAAPPVIVGKAATPSSSVPDGVYDSSVSVALTSSGSDAIYYTLDGSTPTTSSTLYSGPISVSSTTRIRAFAVLSGASDSNELDILIRISVATPIITPPGGIIEDSASVTIESSTSAASIYYTIDGSDPTTSSTLYTGPILVNGTQSIKAIAVKAGLQDSLIAEALFIVGAGVSVESGFTNIPLTEQTGVFSYEFSAVPASDNIDGVIGFTDGPNLLIPGTDPAAFQQLAVIIRFFTNGRIEARDGSSYVSVMTSYSGGLSYRFKVYVDIPNKQYRVTVTSPAGVTASSDLLSFRTEQLSAASLSNIAMTHVENPNLPSGDYVSIANLQFSQTTRRPSLNPRSVIRGVFF